MSRKNKNLRAFLHQNQNPSIQETWDAAWSTQFNKSYSLKIKAMQKAQGEKDKRIAELEKLNKNLERQFVEDTAKIQELENLLTGRGPSQVS